MTYKKLKEEINELRAELKGRSLNEWNLKIALKVSSMVSEYADIIGKTTEEAWVELFKDLTVLNNNKPINKVIQSELNIEVLIRLKLLYPAYVYLSETLEII